MPFWCSLVSVFSCLTPLPLYNLFVCLFNKKEKKRKILSVVKSSHIGNVWYWDGGFHLLRDTKVHMEFCCWCVSVFTCVIPFLVYVCVFNQKIKKMILSVVKSSHNSKVWYLEEIISCFATLTAACSFCVELWVYSLFSFPFLYTYVCLLVFIKKN